MKESKTVLEILNKEFLNKDVIVFGKSETDAHLVSVCRKPFCSKAKEVTVRIVEIEEKLIFSTETPDIGYCYYGKTLCGKVVKIL